LKIIGLAGGSGSGKSTVCRLFSDFGFAFINTDEVYHELTSAPSPCLDEIVREFGFEVLNSDNSLNRQKLAETVFREGESERLKRLNKIAHFHVLKRTEEIISELSPQGLAGVLVDAPLLFESGFDKKCDVIISVIADEKTRILRITERDKITEEKAKSRISHQLPNEFLKQNSHFCIVNDGNLDTLTKRVKEISEKIKQL